MRKILSLLLTAITFSTFSLYGLVDTQDIGPEDTIPEESAKSERGPFKVDLLGDYIWPAEVDNCSEFGKVTFATAMAEFDFICYYDECYKEGGTVGLMFEETYLHMNNNPFFSENNYESASLVVSVFTERVSDWKWLAQGSANFDNLPHFDFADYMTYDILAWGRYKCLDNLGMHIGFFAQAGMKYDRVYPIIGIDWEYDCHWKINAVFPVDISAVYTIDPSWSVALEGRFITQRHRAKRDEPLPEAFWAYQSGGAELAVNYNPSDLLKANLHAGYSFGGHLTIRNRNYGDPKRLRLNGAPYAGAEVALHF